MLAGHSAGALQLSGVSGLEERIRLQSAGGVRRAQPAGFDLRHRVSLGCRAGLVSAAEKTNSEKRRALRIHLTWIPLYAVLWGAYLGSNLFWFHILMPISGLLKSSNSHDHLLGHNLPHTALLSLAICAISLLILWRKQRDRWFLFAELPFFFGILMHAAYITLRMTRETRWTWYYVSWALLAALTASRAAACLFRAVRR